MFELSQCNRGLVISMICWFLWYNAFSYMYTVINLQIIVQWAYAMVLIEAS